MPLCRNAVFTGILAQQRHECAFYFVPILGLDRYVVVLQFSGLVHTKQRMRL